MRSETSEALGRLVSIFVAAIEGAGEVIPDSAIDQLAADPLGTCERLNELALSCGAIDEGVDTALAAIYESMDAADARGNVDEECVAHVVAAWTNTHVERPVEEPAAAEAKPESEEKAGASYSIELVEVNNRGEGRRRDAGRRRQRGGRASREAQAPPQPLAPRGGGARGRKRARNPPRGTARREGGRQAGPQVSRPRQGNRADREQREPREAKERQEACRKDG